MVRIDSEYKFLGDSISGIAEANSTTDIDYKMTGNYIIYGAEMLYDRALHGDSIQFQIIDKDNILGYGAGLVVHNWIVKWYIDSHANSMRQLSDFGGTVLKDLYIRLKYTNIDENSGINVKVNFFFICKE
jgi:hypothetical protein